ncbi:MAG: LacI family DNA-binding transcriptional regulator [Candidatus Ornithospirochaeta sp.]
MATLSDIAKRANVSQAAASRVLNQDPTFVVSKEVRLAIRKAAQEMGYRTPRQKKDDIKVIKVGIADWRSVPASRRNEISYDNLVPLSQLDAEYRFTRLRRGKTEDLDAIIAIGIFSDEEIDELILSSHNIIFLNNSQSASMFDRMFIDYDTAMRKCFGWLKEKGCSKIAFINGIAEEDGITIGFKRTEGVRSVMIEEGIYDESLFLVGDLTEESGRKMMAKALERGADAVVLGTQLIEEGVLEEYEKSDKKPLIVLRRDIDLDYRKTKYPVVRMCSEQLWDVTNRLIYSRRKRPSLPLTVYIQASFECE